MKESLWITREECLACHEELLAPFGGLAGVRDRGLLESALARPQQLFSYGSPSLFECAASYAAGIVKSHPFLDGSKRAGFMAVALFLESNSMKFQAPGEEVVLQTLALSAGEIDEKDHAFRLGASCVEDR